jgi:hypothetical protein
LNASHPDSNRDIQAASKEKPATDRMELTGLGILRSDRDTGMQGLKKLATHSTENAGDGF